MPIADLASSFNAFFESAATFFRHLSEVHWTPLALALVLLAAMQVARAWSWRNVLRAAYPQASIPFPSLCAAYLAGAGDQRDRPGAGGRRHQGLPGQAPDPGLLLPRRHLLLPRPLDLRHGRRPPRPPLRGLPGAAAAASDAAQPARLRDLLLGRPPAGVPDRGGVADPGDRRRRLPARPPRAPLLGAGQAGRRRSSPGRAATCARSPPGRRSAGSAASPPSGSSSRRSGSAARSAA